MNLEVRPAEPDELLAALRPIWLYGGSAPTEERAQSVLRFLEPGRLHAAFDGEEAVGGAGAFSFQLTVPGGRVAAAGATVVGVMPTHRRRGVLTGMMRAQLEDAHRRGEPVAILWASEAGIYGRFGYGAASLCGTMRLERAHGAFRPTFEPLGKTRLVDQAEALSAFPAVYDRIAAETPGMFARSPAWWEHRLLFDPEWRRDGAGEQVRVLVELGGRPDAYGLYRIREAYDWTPTSTLEVQEAVGASPQSTAELWRYLLDIDLMHTVVAELLPVDHPLQLLLVDARRMRFRVGDGLWLRLVDVGAALSARSYATEDTLVLEVRDTFCPWNAGRWKLRAAEAERTTAPAELALDVGDLASVYLGGFTWGQLARAGLVEELAEGTLGRADALFRAERAPWCPEIF
ncbi:MAG TPA: GNAT family N-acetyltransferase [Gaiellaceae bacterium]|nr:GNAT family N-acetyltransferase [Gaiellaceae bacterium]